MSEADSLKAMSRTAAASIAGILFLTLGAVAQGQVTVASISPNSGTISGGTSVQMNGTNFQSGAAVTFGSTPATSVTVVNSTTITATTPSHAVGAVNVTVTQSGRPKRNPVCFASASDQCGIRIRERILGREWDRYCNRCYQQSRFSAQWK